MKQEPDSRTDELARSILDAAFEVHRCLGPGFLESVYEEALCYELDLRGIPHERQVTLFVNFKSHPVGQSRLDILVDNLVIVELKAAERLVPVHTATVISYLKATGCKLGLLINFNVRF